jgi:GrpB-like predicted nucleotidyltransferase (UPF0157 family)
MAIEIVPYRDAWPEEFRTIAAPMRTALGDLARRIDHIGSTSVPGLPAKDIIDLQVTVAVLEPSEPLTAAFARAGYARHPTIAWDHRPPGDTTSEEQWQKLYFRAADGNPRIHVHVRVDGRANQRYPLLFRDYLRAHPGAAAAYAEVKRQLARHGPDDLDLYYDVKDPVCDIIMAAAREWAAAIGWDLGPSDA